MSDLHNMIEDSVGRLFGDLVTRNTREAFDRDGIYEPLWQACRDAGLERAMASEAHGGIGAEPADAFAILHAIGYHAAATPLADTLMAAWLLSSAGIEPPEGAIALLDNHHSAARLQCEPSPEQAATVSGQISRSTWSAQATWGVASVGSPGDHGQARIALVALEQGKRVRLKLSHNRAGEPTADLKFDAARVQASAVLAWHGVSDPVLYAGALARSVQMVGALERVLELSVKYALERSQFGKPIGKNQALQQMLAALAGQIASARSAAMTACSGSANSAFDIAVAKVRTSEAAGVGAGTAHQVHGAIGFTQEHDLHFFTRRLWSWRNEFGTDAWWSQQLGRAAIAAGPTIFWSSVVARGWPSSQGF